METMTRFEICETQVTWIIPPECQGQIVVWSYGWHAEEGDLYRCRYDQSDRSVQYWRADPEEIPWDSWDGCLINEAPPVTDWIEVNHD